MTVRERILTIRLGERIQKQPGYAIRIGVTAKVHYKNAETVAKEMKNSIKEGVLWKAL